MHCIREKDINLVSDYELKLKSNRGQAARPLESATPRANPRSMPHVVEETLGYTELSQVHRATAVVKTHKEKKQNVDAQSVMCQKKRKLKEKIYT